MLRTPVFRSPNRAIGNVYDFNCKTTIMCKNNEKKDKFYGKVTFPPYIQAWTKIMRKDKFYRKIAFLMYTEMVNFRPQS